MHNQNSIKVDGAALAGKFPERLYQARQQLGWSQSETARQVWGETTDSRGYTVAKNRDRISAYENGKSTPGRDYLDLIAKVFGVDVAVLAPDLLAARDTFKAAPPVVMTVIDVEKGHVHLTVNAVIPMSVASRIVAMLSETGVLIAA
jgi:transcriptional regulator with XRE-family HTH domain